MAPKSLGKPLGKTAKQVCKTVKGKAASKPILASKTVSEVKHLTEAAAILKQKTPADWPKDIVPNVRAFGPLPDGWSHGKKITNASGRGSGGKFLRCYVGPKGKVFYNKTDLEKFIGHKIEAATGAGCRRTVSPLMAQAYPPDGVLRRTDKVTKSDYIIARCDAVAGYSVKEALLTFTYEYKGNSYNYGVSDLKYDIRCGLLAVDTATSKEEGLATQRSNALPAPALVGTTLSTCRTNAAAGKTKLLVEKEADGEQTAERLATTAAVGRLGKRACAASTACAPTINAPKQWWSKESLRHIQKFVYGPLKNRAAAGMADETAVMTLLGVGYQFGMDAIMLNVLPSILQKEPSDRGTFGEVVLNHFEAALNKHALAAGSCGHRLVVF